jgi:hypothetical protein
MITLDNTINEIKDYLGERKFKNLEKIYNYIKCSESTNETFKLDYLQSVNVDKYFILEFLDKEKDFDLDADFCEMECDDVIDNINNGYTSFIFL